MSIFRHSEIEAEYERWKRKLPLDCSNLGLNYDDVLTVHFILVDMFYGRQSGIGGIGPKSLDLMISAVSRQDVSFGGIDKWSRPEELAATLMYGIILNHPFFDANKRTAFLSTILLLNKYGITITIRKSSSKISPYQSPIALLSVGSGIKGLLLGRKMATLSI